ncbi:hypothetical protein Tco_0909475 [Tanacetum coccineum]|uniref:Uncharacterized protein n=1 Tax=Tanacetum coccineum TaxID=301880 RepID=A0ABQ5CRB6_9ASTR
MPMAFLKHVPESLRGIHGYGHADRPLTHGGLLRWRVAQRGELLLRSELVTGGLLRWRVAQAASYGNVSDVITGGTKGAVHQGPVRAEYYDLSAEEMERLGEKREVDSGRVWLKMDDRESQLTMEFDTSVISRRNHSRILLVCLLESNMRVNANENRIIWNWFASKNNDPLALCRTPQASAEVLLQKNLMESLSNSLALLTHCYKSHLPNKQSLRGRQMQGTKLWLDGKAECGGLNRGGIFNLVKRKPSCVQLYGLGREHENVKAKRLQDLDYFKEKIATNASLGEWCNTG